MSFHSLSVNWQFEARCLFFNNIIYNHKQIPRQAKCATFETQRENSEVVLRLMKINIYILPMSNINIYIYIYIYNLFVYDFSFEELTLIISLFRIRNILSVHSYGFNYPIEYIENSFSCYSKLAHNIKRLMEMIIVYLSLI